MSNTTYRSILIKPQIKTSFSSLPSNQKQEILHSLSVEYFGVRLNLCSTNNLSKRSVIKFKREGRNIGGREEDRERERGERQIDREREAERKRGEGERQKDREKDRQRQRMDLGFVVAYC